MKAFTAIFGISVAGIVVCLGMTVYLGIKEHQQRQTPAPITLPTPAMAR